MTSIFLPIKTIGFLAYSKPRCPSQTMGTPFWCRDFYPHVTCSARRSVHVHVNVECFGTWLDWNQVLSRSMGLLYIYRTFKKSHRSYGEWSFLGKFSVPKPWIKGILGCNQHHLRWPSIGKCVYMVVLICPDHCPTLLMCFFLINIYNTRLGSNHLVRLGCEKMTSEPRREIAVPPFSEGDWIWRGRRPPSSWCRSCRNSFKAWSFDIIQRRTRRTQEILQGGPPTSYNCGYNSYK